MKLSFVTSSGKTEIEGTVTAIPDGDGAISVSTPDAPTRRIRTVHRPGNVVQIWQEREGGHVVFEATVFRTSSGDVTVSCNGQTRTLSAEAGARSSSSITNARGLGAPMSGTIVAVHFKTGDHVEGGDSLYSIEAMKVVSTVDAPAAGTLTSIRAVLGHVVAEGEVLVDLAYDPASDGAA